MPTTFYRVHIWSHQVLSSRKPRAQNAPGVRIGGIANTATFRAAQRTPPRATFVASVDAAIAGMNAGEIDCIALSRESLSGLVTKILGSRILEGGFLISSTAVALPKDKPGAYASAFIEGRRRMAPSARRWMR